VIPADLPAGAETDWLRLSLATACLAARMDGYHVGPGFWGVSRYRHGWEATSDCCPLGALILAEQPGDELTDDPIVCVSLLLYRYGGAAFVTGFLDGFDHAVKPDQEDPVTHTQEYARGRELGLEFLDGWQYDLVHTQARSVP